MWMFLREVQYVVFLCLTWMTRLGSIAMEAAGPGSAVEVSVPGGTQLKGSRQSAGH